MGRYPTARLCIVLLPFLSGSARGEPPPADLRGDALPPGAVARLGTARLRHGGAIMGLTYSPDGKTLATLGRDNVVGLWDAASGRELQRFPAGGIGVNDLGGLAFSPDGTTVAVTGWAVRLWDVAARREAPRQVRHPHYVEFAAFSPDGKVLAVGGPNGAVSLWAMPAVTKLRDLPAESGEGEFIHCAAFSPDGKVLASARGGLVRLWDADTGKEIRRLKQDGELRAVAFAPDGKALAAASRRDDNVHLWDTTTGKEIRRWKAHAGGVWAVAFRPDGAALASAGGDTTVLLSDPATGRELRRLSMSPPATLALAFSPDGKTLAAAGTGNAVRLWDPDTGKQRLPVASHEGPVVSLAFTADGRTVASGGADGCVGLWDPATGRARHRWPGSGGHEPPAWAGPHPEAVDAVALAPDGKALAVASRASLRLWDPTTGKELDGPRLREEAYHRYGERRGCALSGDGRTLAYDDAGAVRLWDVRGARSSAHFEQPGHVKSFLFTPDGRGLMTLTRDTHVSTLDKARCREIATGKELSAVGAWSYNGGAFNPDGRTVALVEGERADLFDMATGEQLFRVDGNSLSGTIAAVALSPDGRTLAVSGKDKDRTIIRLWEVATGTERRQFVGHRGAVSALAFSADSRLLASGSADTTALVWDVYGRSEPAPRPADLESLWDDLARPDGARAYRALCALLASAGPAWSFLKERVRPVPVVSAPELARLIADLDGDEFATRERVGRELARLEKAAEPALREALGKTHSAEVRRRLEEVLAGGEWLRAVRAIEALERIGTPEARQLLKELASGAPEARLTREAQAALTRARTSPARGRSSSSAIP